MHHLVSHPLLLVHFHLQGGLLFALNFDAFLGLFENLFIEVFPLLQRLLSELSAQFDLLIENLSHLLHFVHLHLLLLLNLLFMQSLAELLNLSPLVFANVRRHVLDFHACVPIFPLPNLDLVAHFSGACLALLLVLGLRVLSLHATTCHHIVQILHEGGSRP